jgi:hypothetical protein
MDERPNKYEYWLAKPRDGQVLGVTDYTVIRRDIGPDGTGKYSDGSEISLPWECIASDEIYSDKEIHDWFDLIKKLDLEQMSKEASLL